MVSVALATMLLAPSGLEVKPGWMKGLYCEEPESFAQIRKELPEIPSDFNITYKMRGDANDFIQTYHNAYRKNPNLDDLYRIVILGEQDPGSFSVAAEHNYPKLYEEFEKYDRLPSDMVKRLFCATSRLNQSRYDLDFAEMMLSRYGHDDKIRLAYLCRQSYAGIVDFRLFKKCKGIAFQLCAIYPNSGLVYEYTSQFFMRSIVSPKLTISLLDEILDSIDEFEVLYKKSGRKISKDKEFMNFAKEAAERQRAKLLAKGKGGG